MNKMFMISLNLSLVILGFCGFCSGMEQISHVEPQVPVCKNGPEIQVRQFNSVGTIPLPKGSKVFPVCSAGLNRSQVLYIVLKELYGSQIDLQVPFGATQGLDTSAQAKYVWYKEHVWDGYNNDTAQVFFQAFGVARQHPWGYDQKEQSNEPNKIFNENVYKLNGEDVFFVVFDNKINGDNALRIKRRLQVVNKDLQDWSRVHIFEIVSDDPMRGTPEPKLYRDFAQTLRQLFLPLPGVSSSSASTSGDISTQGPKTQSTPLNAAPYPAFASTLGSSVSATMPSSQEEKSVILEEKASFQKEAQQDQTQRVEKSKEEARNDQGLEKKKNKLYQFHWRQPLTVIATASVVLIAGYLFCKCGLINWPSWLSWRHA